MRVAISYDHAGFSLRQSALETIRELGHRPFDVGPRRLVPGDDYPDSAQAVAEAVRSGRADRGIVICGSGVGACVAANKFPDIRAALCADTFSARQGVEDDNANILCLGSRVVGPALAREILTAFLKARFSGAARHRRRLKKVQAIEARFFA